MKQREAAVLLIHCQDQKGIVARVAGYIHDLGGNILDSDHHTDQETGDFLMRTVFDLEGFQVSREEIGSSFSPVAKCFGISYQLYFLDERPRVGILVSHLDHCLADLLQRQRRGELQIDIPLIVSNHEVGKFWADLLDIPFSYFPIQDGKKPEQEEHVLNAFKPERVSLIVMARYMQILSNNLPGANRLPDYQYSPFVSPSVYGRETLSPSLSAGSQNYWSHGPLCHRRPG